ncbi:hypothetical protein CHS0354_006082 [Potamilus streckersoni]|uniref:Uncharacterized protein n=1 Tax=Potamilus streckersoni TaxID=2493646 RepID=A0AAE0STN6_9BIVA|nr:hypothetical protein CHS0354_006082 [Potamilus streckersoni]
MTASTDTPITDREVYKILRPTDCSPVYYEARLKKHPNKEAISEYQASNVQKRIPSGFHVSFLLQVYKKWPWQPPRESLAPYVSRHQDDAKTKFSDVTTYRNDFLGLKFKKPKKSGKNHKLEDKQTQTEMGSDFNSTYNLEYYPKKCAERSRPYTPCQSRINSITSGPDQSRPMSSYQSAYKQRDKLQTAEESDKEKENEKKEDKNDIKKKPEEKHINRSKSSDSISQGASASNSALLISFKFYYIALIQSPYPFHFNPLQLTARNTPIAESRWTLTFQEKVSSPNRVLSLLT